jgi:hypothetical protein
MDFGRRRELLPKLASFILSIVVVGMPQADFSFRDAKTLFLGRFCRRRFVRDFFPAPRLYRL